jgi:hypothetical protein
MFDWLTYEHRTVKTVRGSKKSLEKLQADGWELVSQESGAIRKTVKVRRARTREGWLRIGGVAAAAVVVATAVTVGAVLEDDSGEDQDSQSSHDGNASDGVSSASTKPPPTGASSLHPPMKVGPWVVVDSDFDVSRDQLGSFSVAFYVLNTGEKPAQGYFHVTFLKGDKVLGTADCRTDTGSYGYVDVPAGAERYATCLSSDELVRGWTEITVERDGSHF